MNNIDNYLQELWNDFCHDVSTSKKKKSKEKDFERGPVKDFLTSLGWVKYGSHRLVEQHPIQFATAWHYADFALFLQDDSKPEMIIELKRPARKKEEKDVAQLEDYMVKEGCCFGLLVGEVLELYFIDFSKPKHFAELVSTIEFKENDSDIIQIISLILKQNYETDKLREYCIQQLKLNEIVAYWNSTQGKDNILSYILKSSSLPDSLKGRLQRMMSIDIYVHHPIESFEEVNEYPVVRESFDDDYHLFKVKMKHTDASIRYYPSEKRYVIMAGSMIRKESTDSFKNRTAIAKREEVFNDKSWSKDMGKCVELLRDVEFVTDAPNTPTQFCTARSTNATEALIDEEGRRYADVYQNNSEQKTININHQQESSEEKDNFKESCIRRVSKVIGKELVRKSTSEYVSSDGKKGYVFRTSKIYPQGNRERYWFAYRRVKTITNCKDQYYVFGCNNANTIIILPVFEIEARIKGLNYSQDENGNPLYWHIVFLKDSKGKMTWLISKPNIFEIDITDKLL